MQPPLYLDTARIGLLTPEAKQACEDALALAMRDPSTAFREFSRGYESSIIRHWQGIPSIQHKLLRMVGCPAHQQLMMASNSGTLLSVASRCLYDWARKPLLTDLAWPNHLNQLRLEKSVSTNELSQVNIRDAILAGMPPKEIASLIAQAYQANECDAIFLTAVSSDGLRLPIRKILAECKRIRRPRFVIVDGAQEFAHLDRCSVSPGVDMYLFGTHKWLGAYHPLNVATFGCERSREFIETIARSMIRLREISDPTFRFANEPRESSYETLNMLPYFSLAGALATASKSESDASQSNTELFLMAAEEAGWRNRYRMVHPDLRTSIAVIERRAGTTGSLGSVERKLLQAGLSITELPGGALRASIPRQRFEADELGMVQSSLANI